jgi:hypothetical protein
VRLDEGTIGILGTKRPVSLTLEAARAASIRTCQSSPLAAVSPNKPIITRPASAGGLGCSRHSILDALQEIPQATL